MVFTLSDLGKLICTNLQEIKALISGESYPDDLVLQFPQNSEERILQPGETKEYKTTINRRLMSYAFSAPDGVIAELQNGNDVIMYFEDEFGGMPLHRGVYIGDCTIRAKNTTDTPLKWSCRLNFS